MDMRRWGPTYDNQYPAVIVKYLENDKEEENHWEYWNENATSEHTYITLQKCWNSSSVSNIARLPTQSQAYLPTSHVQSNLKYT